MEFLLIGIVIIVLFSKLKKDDNVSNKKGVLYSILLFIPLVLIYYFGIALVTGFIFSFFGNYMFYYGLVLGLAFSPLAAIITIFKINNKKHHNCYREKEEEENE